MSSKIEARVSHRFKAEADPSNVAVMIQPELGGCRVTNVHKVDAQWAEYVSRAESGWARMLDEVERLLA